MVPKLKILLVVRWPIGGIRTFIRYVYRRFDATKYQFTILAPENFELDILAQDLASLDIEICRLSEYPSTFEIFTSVLRLVSSGRFNLIHSHGFTSALCSAFPAFIFRIPHIFTSHDMLSAAQFRGFSGKLKRLVIGLALRSITSIHLVSHDALSNLSEFYPFITQQKGKCVVIPNGIESSIFTNAKVKDLRSELKISGQSCFLIGFLGRFMAPKGFCYLVEAVERLAQSETLSSQIKIVVLGSGGFFLEEKAALTERGLDQYFCFLPFSANVAEIIKGLDLVVIPSIWETCPLLPMEVLACGTPLLSSDCIGLREVVRGTPAFVVPSKNALAIADGIKFFMENDRRVQFSEFAPEAARRYDVGESVRALESLIESIIGSASVTG
ncbi:glycosyltransferase family 4 protein [Geomonas nitrogeniifigens]|uniref:Glycosyltransferase family 4 protein n=1 Tax=Geomonas diazotrophica TaxID=2843197 RepID=A0ABX8JCW0_9BACT|nr:glycosyltransferase family 4 protein [Geomonas nitrogeniifigens]QWV95841.1 glycosyltransferase family 4 protein [Geomonas nitrogeniifigens]QXE84926.1 glycosyltransferase family 4 protein [Geomonas nitrogeniifigens]